MLYLVVYDPPNGMAELLNVCVVEASDPVSAREIAGQRMSTTARSALFVKPVAELADGWTYFE